MKKSGDRLGRYVIEAPIGAGGMGDVYEARDTRLGRRVALKLLRSDAGDVAFPRLLREAQASAAFEHPNAVVVFDAGEELGEMFIAMELVRGKPLRALLGDRSTPIGRKIQWMVDVAHAVGAAHRAGLIHRDIKPDNIVLRNDGVIKVLDFGIARRQRASSIDLSIAGDSLGAVTADDVLKLATLTAEGALIGTPAYLSPEQLCREEIDARTDQFAWAVTAYEVLTGEPPWTAADPVTLLSRILTSPPPPLCARFPEIPAPVEAALQRALSKHPRDRFPTIDEAAEALEPFAEPASTGARALAELADMAHGAHPAGAARATPTSNETLEAQAHPSSRLRVTTGAGAARAAAACDVACAPAQPTLTTQPTLTAQPTLTTQPAQPARPTTDTQRPRPGGRRLAVVGSAAALAALAAFVAWPAIRGPGDEGHDPASSARAEAVTALTVRTLACKEARVAGSGASPEIARAIGVGACARLATDVGAGWDPRRAAEGPPDRASPGQNGVHALDVEARIDDGAAVVTLAVGDRRATAEGRTPMDAIVGATSALAQQLAPPAMTPAEVAAWGARDAAGARRIKRVLYRMVLDLAPDDQAAARALLETDADSPWAQYLAWMTDLGGAERKAAWRQGMVDRLDKLPRARALLLPGILQSEEARHRPRAPGDGDDAKEALRLLRQAYAEAPDDPDVAAGFAAQALTWAEDEAVAVLDKLYERAPSYSIFAMRLRLKHAPPADPEMERVAVERLHAVFPESVAWELSVRYAVRAGHLEEARRHVETGVRLGMTGMSSGGFYAESGRVWLALATLDPKGAREIATKMLSVPRDFVVQAGADAVIASYLLEGRLDDALSAERRELERHLANKNPGLAVRYASVDLAQRLLLGQPTPDAERLRWLDDAAAELRDPVTGPEVRLLTGLARLSSDPAKPRRAAEKALKELEALAEGESGNGRAKRDAILVRTLPGVRKLRGNAEAAKRWKEAGRAPLRHRRAFAVEAGLALAATGDAAGAEQAYKLAIDPEDIERDALRTILGRVKLAELYRAGKRDQEAAALEAEVDRVWAGADPGLRDRLRALR